MVPAHLALEGGTVASITTALSTALTTTAGDCMTAIATIAPVAVPVMGAIVVIGIGIKVFKKITGRA